jgi:hypothetical protein
MFRYLKIASCFLSIFLTGCVTPTPDFSGLKFEPSYSADFDYKVTIENTIGGSFDRSQKEERIKMVEQRFMDKCKKTVVLDEVEFVTGQYITRPAITYFLKIKCIN